MDPDYLAQLSIRRSPRAALENQKTYSHVQYEYDHLYDAVPPPVPRRGTVPVEKAKTPDPRSPQLNSLEAHLVTADTATTTPSRHHSLHPFRELLAVAHKLEPEPEPEPEPKQIPRRHPSRLKSYKDSRRPLYLRKRTSLETIDSVRSTASVTPSEEQRDPIESEVPSPGLSILEYADDAFPLPVPTDADASSISSSSIDSRWSPTPISTPRGPIEYEERSPKAMLRRIKLNKTYTNESAVPEPLVIQKKASLDPHASPSSSSSSSNSAVNVPPGQSSITSRSQDFEQTQSHSSSEWSASSFDISGLTEAQLKKCQKKGINPSLYAEMKAARKGKWTSPIAGNTFLG